MPRIPYDIVAPEADRIIIRMAMAPTWELANYYWEVYLGYINACGWSDQEFDKETLRRIDLAWEILWNSVRKLPVESLSNVRLLNRDTHILRVRGKN